MIGWLRGLLLGSGQVNGLLPGQRHAAGIAEAKVLRKLGVAARTGRHGLTLHRLHTVERALPPASLSHTHEVGIGPQFSNGRGVTVAHARTQAAHELCYHLGPLAPERNHGLHPFGRQAVVILAKTLAHALAMLALDRGLE